jgi:hypothetical protein
MSPLLRALTHSRSAHEPVTAAMILQCYASLDAFQHGHGSRDLHLSEIANAQARMIEGLMRSARTRAIAEAVL